MVDFNNDTTVATPPGDVVKIVVLERREQVIEALESYHLKEGQGVETSANTATLRARILAFWHQVQAMAKRRLKPDDYAARKDSMESLKDEDLLEAFEWLNEFVDDMGLTYIDSRTKYDRQHVEDANEKKGL